MLQETKAWGFSRRRYVNPMLSVGVESVPRRFLMTGSVQEAEEIPQDALLKVWEGWTVP